MGTRNLALRVPLLSYIKNDYSKAIPLKLCVYRSLVKAQALNENLNSPELPGDAHAAVQGPRCE